MKIPFFGRLSRTFAILVSISCTALSWSVQSLPMPDNSSYFKVIDTRNGLSGNTISDIAEDCHGFLWIASWSGLTRFDGVRTKNFTPGTTAPHQLSNTVTRALETEPDGIWVATDNGIDFLNFATGAFEHGMAYSQEKPDSISRITTRISRIISNNRYTFALTIHGDLLRIRRNGFEPSGSKPPFLRINNEQGRKYADITPFTSGRIMAYSDRGIYILSENGEKELAHTPFSTKFDANMNIFCDTLTGRTYAGRGIGHPGRAFRMADASGRLVEDPTLFVPDNLMQTSMQHGSVCFATDGDGLWVERPDGTVENFTMSNSSLPGDALYSLHTDSSENLWIGTYRRGMALFSPRLNQFAFANTQNGKIPYDIVTAVLPVGNTIYLGLDGGGFAIYDHENGTSLSFTTRNSGMPGNNVVALCTDGHLIWMAVYTKGLVSYNPSTGEFRTFPLPDSLEPDNKVWAITPGDNNDIWVGGWNLNIFNTATESFTAVAGGKDISVTSICPSGKSMWVASRQSGLLNFDRGSRTILQKSAESDTPQPGLNLPGHIVDFLHADSKGTLWFSMPQKGLFSINPRTPGGIRAYGPQDGITNTHVNAIIEDNHGFLWMGTDNGLFRYNPENGAFFRMKDPRLPATYTNKSAALCGNTIYFGSTEGLVSFAPSVLLTPADTNARMRFTELATLGKNREEISLYSTDYPEVTLPFDRNFFTISYAKPDLVYPGMTQFSYRLLGLEEEWSAPTESLTAEYTSVPPGNYRFQLRYILPDGTWSSPIEMSLRITPPWWGTWWARIIALVILISAAAAVLLLWKEHLLNRQKMKTAMMERDYENRLTNAKLDFFTKITHELRTPVFIITAQMEELLAKGKDVVTVRQSYIAGIYRNAKKLNRLVNNIIDLRKVDLGQTSLMLRYADITAFLQSLVPDYENLCLHKDIAFAYRHGPMPVYTAFDPDKLELVVTNLVSNSFKYTRAGGRVVMSLTEDPENVIISVADNGIGISDKMQTKVFEQYFRTDRGRKEGDGDGIGLAYVKELVELHNGRITLDSREGNGSTFSVLLPKRTPGDPARNAPESEQPATATTESGQTAASSRLDTPHVPSAPLSAPNNPMATHSLLIVEDEREISELLIHAFAADFKVFHASSGQAALEIARQEIPDIILTDLMLPDLDGHALISAIRADSALKSAKIAVLTALNTEDDMLTALDRGADAYFTKPISLKVLSLQLRKLVSTPGAGIAAITHHAITADAASDPTPDAISTDELDHKTFSLEEQKFLIRCRSIIDDNLQNPDFTLYTLSKSLAMSHSALYKKVKTMTGLSLVDFINEYRICKAVLLFRQGNTSVMRVGELCGFRDPKTFRETFKRKMGIPPKQYLQNLL